MPESRPPVVIRKATGGDADAIIGILERIASERIYTAITNPWSVERQRQYLASLSEREAIHVAITESAEIIGYQPLELWAPTLDSMAHVGQIGTFVAPGRRREGAGEALFRRTVEFARQRAYLKFVIQVRSSNVAARGFYERLGFRECGRLQRQVVIGDRYDDEILMEFFL